MSACTADLVATISFWLSLGTSSPFLIDFSVWMILSSFFYLLRSSRPLVEMNRSVVVEKSNWNLPFLPGCAVLGRSTFCSSWLILNFVFKIIQLAIGY